MEKFAFEISFITSMMRIMSYLIPKLCKAVNNEFMKVVHRFSNMVSAMIGISNSNPSVVLEAISFHESLLLHISIMNNAGQQTKAAKLIHTFLSYITLKILPLNKSNVRGNQHEVINHCKTSVECQTAIVNFIMMVARGNRKQLIERLFEDKLDCRLFVLLESVCSSRQNPQNLCTTATPTSGAKVSMCSKQLEIRICDTIKTLFRIHSDFTNLEGNQTSTLLRWIVMTRNLISVDFDIEKSLSTSHDSECEEWKEVLDKATRDFVRDAILICSPSGNTVRWQVKHFAISIFEDAIKSPEQSSDIIKFDLPTIRKATNKTLHPFCFLLYLKDFFAVACSVSTTTIDQGEIYSLQNAGLRLLSTLIEGYSETYDADDPSPEADEKIIENISSQIVPSIKHALSSCDRLDDEDFILAEGSRELFLTGCHCLLSAVRAGLVSDAFSLKRMLKSLIIAKDQVQACPYPKESSSFVLLHLKPKSFVDNRMSVLLPRIGKMSSLAKLCILADLKLIPQEAKDTIFNEIRHVQKELAIISSALALDSHRLLLSKESSNENEESRIKSGLTFPNLNDINETASNEMTQNWVSYCGLASILMREMLKDKDENSQDYQLMISWCEKLVVALLAGFHRSINCFDSSNAEETRSAEHSCTVCLMALQNIMEVQGQINGLFEYDDRNVVLQLVLKTVLYAWVVNKDDSEIKYNPKSNDATALTLAAKACEFVESAFETTSDCVDIGLVATLLSPLVEIQESDESYKFDDSMRSRINNSLVTCLEILNGKDLLDHNIVKALLDLCVKNIHYVHEDENAKAFSRLMRSCLVKDCVTEKQRTLYASHAAHSGNWAAWELICSCTNDVKVIIQSKELLESALNNYGDQHVHQSVLGAICNVLKVHDNWTPNVLGTVGYKVLDLFGAYGTSGTVSKQNRILACSTCLKLIMMSVQFLINQGNEIPPGAKSQFDTEVAKYLTVIFEKFVLVISYNGLPNQQNYSNAGSDGIFGRMCAQFFVFILRSCASSFKLCISQLEERSRMILESSVRADMSGYAAQSTAPTKKKLNIKSFVSAK